MDLSGAFVGSNAVVYRDCSGDECDNSNVPPSMPASFESRGVSSEERELDILRRYVGPTPSNPTLRITAPANDEDERNEVVPSKPLISREQVLYYSIQVVNFVWNILSVTLKYTKKVTTGVVSSLRPELFYFFKDSHVPYDSRRVNLQSAGAPHVDWYYNADYKLFFREENDGHQHHFPYLTAEIYHGDLALYDITSFTESLHWTGGNVAPSANHLLAAWYLETGILLDPSLPLVLKVTNEEGETVSVPLVSSRAAATT